VKVEDEEQARPLKHDNPVLLVLERNVRLRRRQPLEGSLGVVHGRVKSVQVLVPEEVVINQVELPTRVLEGRVVADSREIEPLWVPELVAFKVEIAFSAE
jgi:hypothetical protein